MKLDKIDLSILSVLQEDSRVSNQKLAAQVGLSPSPCWRRVKRLEEAGLIARYVTLLDAEAAGLPVHAYLHVSLDNHHPDTVAAFDSMVQARPEVLECYAMSGEYDYLLRVVASSMSDYERFMTRHLLREAEVQTANTSFVLKRIKYTTALPLPRSAAHPAVQREA